jgi:glutamyl-tRNA reductase
MRNVERSELQVAAFTLSHPTAPVETRERLATVSWEEILSEKDAVREWALLSTCHRFELYVVAPQDEIATLCAEIEKLFENALATLPEVGATEAPVPWALLIGEAVVTHLCRVATGLDSLVLGEAQIQGQVIATYTEGLEEGRVGPFLSALFRTAIRAGKRARTETPISTRASSMSTVALAIAARHFRHFSQAKVLVVGAGEMSRLALKALLQRQVANVTVANRTLARAQAALLHPNWHAIPLDQLPDLLHTYDVVFTATSAPDYIITQAALAAARQHADVAPTQVIIDLAVPRDVDPDVREMASVVLVDVDDLRHGVDESLEQRKEAVPAINEIIHTEVARWQHETRELAVRPYVVELRQRAEDIRQQEVARTLRFIGPLDDATSAHIDHLSRALVNKILHQPTVRMKKLAHNGDADHYVAALRELFGLEADSHVEVEPIDEAIEKASEPNHV